MEPVRRRLAELAPGVELLREPALRPGRGGQRRRLRQAADRRHRRLRQRRVRGVAPRPRLDRRPAALPPVGDGPAVAARGRGAARAAREPRSVRSSPCSVAPRSATSWASSRRCSTPSTPSSSAGRCASRSSPPRVARSVSRCSNPIRSTRASGCWRAARRSTCRRTSSASMPPATSPRGAPGCPTVARVSTSVPARRPSSPTSSPRPERCSGTGRWGCSRTSASRPARGRSPRRSRRRRRSRSSAVATRRRRSPSSASTTTSTTCPPVVVRRSSCSSSATCPDSPRSDRAGGAR